MTKSDLLGWTLAELALALLFALLAVFAPSIKQLAQQSSEIKKEDKEAQSLATENKRLRDEDALLRLKFEASRANLKSSMLPSCFELDKKSGWLFTAIVESDDSFAVGGESLSLSQIRRRYADQIATASARGCVERVRVGFERGMSAEVYELATRRLGQYFYLAPVGER